MSTQPHSGYGPHRLSRQPQHIRGRYCKRCKNLTACIELLSLTSACLYQTVFGRLPAAEAASNINANRASPLHPRQPSAHLRIVLRPPRRANLSNRRIRPNSSNSNSNHHCRKLRKKPKHPRAMRGPSGVPMYTREQEQEQRPGNW